MMVRKELGGYCPKDPLKLAFMSTVIAISNESHEKDSTENRLQNLIQKSK